MVLCNGQLAKGGGPKKRFQYCLNPNSSEHFLYFRAIQGHSGGNLVDLELQDNVPLTDDFTEYICHIGNISETHSIIRSGGVPEEEVSKGKDNLCFYLKRTRWTMTRVWRKLQAKDRYIQKYLETSSKLSILVQFELAQKRELQFYQTRSHAIVLYNKLPAVCFEKAICMKTKEELYHKVYLSPRLPRVVLKANSQSGQQDQQEQDARTSCDTQAHRRPRETWCSNVDYTIPDIHHFAVEQQDTNRRDTVKKLIQQFASHPNKESFLQDLNKTEEINKFSDKSHKLIADMNNTEIFEFCETSSKKAMPRL